MKTITREYKIYTFDELSQEAKDKARSKFNENDDLPFLQDDLREYIHEELEARGIKALGVSTSKEPSIRPLYDLSYSQGSGLMFEATLEDKLGNVYTIKHRGHYYHERSADIDGQDKDGNDIDVEEFAEGVYIPICKKVAARGYDEIEYAQSEEAFRETCEACEYTFLEDGTMFNE